MDKASLAGSLVAPSGLAHFGAAHLRGAIAAVALAAITAAANEYLLPAAGAQEQSARRFHRRSQRDTEDSRQRASAVKY
ncbi:hypothetical protein [Herminiimonas contaminans]|uniref:Uncharacterized protein n=1 Tax=Herminiimonas contaminans TaxID=1111140 RepID=A0ABS0EZ21_9BURK|nr:hypothetical protein [Herminiimonas contaminans]MBF8179143.1 hypothetical protein [Herminiimonas contaminans]